MRSHFSFSLRAALVQKALPLAPREERLSAVRPVSLGFGRLALVFAALIFAPVPGCATGPQAPKPSSDRTADAPDGAAEVPVTRLPDPNPARIVWEDFHRRGSRITLVTPGWERSGLKLEQGRLEPSTKVVEPEIVNELVKFMRSEGFYDRGTEVDPRAAVSVDAKLKAAITLERDGRRLSVFHVLGSGDSPGGQAAVDSFVTMKKAILAVYNATTQYSGIVERH